MYTISKGIHRIANTYGLVVEPSRKGNYKLDVYNIKGKYITSIGDNRYKDYWIYRKEKGQEYADFRRELYFIRHQRGIEQAHTREVLSALLLWAIEV